MDNNNNNNDTFNTSRFVLARVGENGNRTEPSNPNHQHPATECGETLDDEGDVFNLQDGHRGPFQRGRCCDDEADDENSVGGTSCTSSRGDSSVGSDDWPIEANHLCYELESNNLPCQNRHGDVLELRSSFIRERDVPRIRNALEQNTSVATADLCQFSFSKLQPASRLAILTSICAMPGLRTLYLNHFHEITIDMVHALADGWSSSYCSNRQRGDPNQVDEKRGGDDDSDKKQIHAAECMERKRKFESVASQFFSFPAAAAAAAAVSCMGGKSKRRIGESHDNNNNNRHNNYQCQIRSLRMQDCGFDKEPTCFVFWERASATLSGSLRLLEINNAQTPLSAFSFSTFLRSCGRQPVPTLQHLHLTSDVMNPTMLSWSVLTGGLMECRQSLRSFSLRRVDSVAPPMDIFPDYAMGYTMGRALRLADVPQEVAVMVGEQQAPPPFSGMLSLLIPVFATFPHLKTLRLQNWHLEAPIATLLATTLANSFKALKCLDLNDCEWVDPMLLHTAIAKKSLRRLHLFATQPAALHIHSLTTHLPMNGSLVQVTVGGLSEALEFPVAMESIVWYVRLNQLYRRQIMIDPASQVQSCFQVLWRARDDVPALYHLLRETPNLTSIIEQCLSNLA